MKSAKNSVIMILFFAVVVLNIVTPACADENLYVHDFISGLIICRPQVFEGIAVFPLASDIYPDNMPFVTLEKALEKAYLEIKEVNGGQVPQVRCENKSSEYIFIMGGEVITGCKQDRILGKDILIQPGKHLLVPVYCVEQGRWTYESTHFFSKKNAGTFNLRFIAQSGKGSAQLQIWDEVSKMNEAIEVDTETGAYQDAYCTEEQNPVSQADAEEFLKTLVA